MKTSIYIEDGTVQLVITPETEFEENALSTFRDKPMKAKLFVGSFYDCRGGWVRQTAYTERDTFDDVISNKEPQSLILQIKETTAESSELTETEKIL